MTAPYIPIPDPLRVQDTDIRTILVAIIENLRMLAGMGPYASDPRRAVRSDANSELANLIGRINSVQLDQLISVSQSIAQFSTAFDTLNGRVDTVESTVSGHGTRLNALDAETTGRVFVLEGDMSGVKNRLDSLDTATTGRVSVLESTVSGHGTRLDALDNATTGIVPDHEQRISDLEAEVFP